MNRLSAILKLTPRFQLTKWWSTKAPDNLIGTCEIKIQRLLTEKVSQTGGLTDTLKATHRIYHPLPQLETSEDGNSSAPYVQATGQAGTDQQAMLRNLFLRRYRFRNGRYSSRGAAAPFAPIKTTGRAATLSARGAERARGSTAAGVKGCRIPTGMRVPVLAPLPWGRGEGGPDGDSARGQVASSVWPVLLLCVLNIIFPLKLFFPLKNFFFPFLFYFSPLESWSHDTAISVRSLTEMTRIAIPFLWPPKSILMVVVVGFSHLDSGS